MSDYEWGIFATMDVQWARAHSDGGFVQFSMPESGDEVVVNICDRDEFARICKAKRVNVRIDWRVVE